MPAGDDPLPPGLWQPVPGAPEARIYPLIRKPDTISSNSYLLDTPDAILLIDPGGLPEQAGLLARLVGDLRAADPRPVFIILTHAHIDHFVAARHVPPFDNPAITVVAVQESGARALGLADPRLTQAAMFDRHFEPFFPGIRLCAPLVPGKVTGSFETVCTNGARVTVTPGYPAAGLRVETICFGPESAIIVIHTPGHSPDSICIRLGSLLFSGDILFAANPGIAGLPGWDQAALIRSLDGIGAILDEGGIGLVCPGHGRVLKAADASRMFAAIRNDALALENITELNRERSIEAAEYAADCMEQVDELFTIIAGRLAFVAYVLEELGEDGMAGETGGLIAGATIDELLDAFRAFSLQHEEAGDVSIFLALKAGQIVGKLERLLNEDELAGVIDPSLVRRASGLLADYTTMLRGFTPPCERTACELYPFIRKIVRGMLAPHCPDEDVFSAADDADAFLLMLRKRIGARPLLEEVDIALAGPGSRDGPIVEIDTGDFTDLVTYILEDLIGSGAGRIRIMVEADRGDGTTRLIFEGEGCPARAGTERGGGFLARLCRRAGGSLICNESPGTRSYELVFDCVPSPSR